jgi:cell division septum initiation protein DivIVA
MLIDEVSKRQPRVFRSQFRGYARNQVDEELSTMDDELRATRADLEATTRRCDHLTELIDQARAERDGLARRYQAQVEQVEQLRQELDRLRPETDKRMAQTPAALHMQRMIENAEQEANLIRRAAIEQSEHLRQQSEQLLCQRVELVEQTEQETQRCLAKAAEQAGEIVRQAVEQSQLLLKDIQDRQAAFDATYCSFDTANLVPEPRQDETVEQPVDA